MRLLHQTLQQSLQAQVCALHDCWRPKNLWSSLHGLYVNCDSYDLGKLKLSRLCSLYIGLHLRFSILWSAHAEAVAAALPNHGEAEEEAATEEPEHPTYTAAAAKRGRKRAQATQPNATPTAVSPDDVEHPPMPGATLVSGCKQIPLLIQHLSIT